MNRMEEHKLITLLSPQKKNQKQVCFREEKEAEDKTIQFERSLSEFNLI